jgi:outer membrane lipoprotein LolB
MAAPAAAHGRRRAAAALLAAAALAGCQSLPPPAAPAAGALHQAGRFSLSVIPAETGGADQREAWSGRFALDRRGATLSLDLVSPLGATLARFESEPGEARLLTPQGGSVRVERGPDLQSLSERVLGWSLPLAGLPDWIDGHPAAGRPYQVAPEAAQTAQGPDHFEQDGWDVRVQWPQGEHAGLRLQMSRAAQAQAPEVALRVVLDAAPAGGTP